MKDVIFDLSNPVYLYKGVYFSELDIKALGEIFSTPPPSDFEAGILGIIYADEKGDVIYKMRIKYSSGNKQVFSKNLGPNGDVQDVLNFMKRFPESRKCFVPCKEGSANEVIKILEDNDMIEFKTLIEKGTANE